MSSDVDDPAPIPKPAIRHRDTPQQALARHETRARELWKRGDLDGARDELREVLRLAGRGGRADIAYGDLMSIARQRSNPDELGSIEREYLLRFPNGRFADDVRAAICRRQSGARVPACWKQYLRDYPTGAYQREAARQASMAEAAASGTAGTDPT